MWLTDLRYSLSRCFRDRLRLQFHASNYYEQLLVAVVDNSADCETKPLSLPYSRSNGTCVRDDALQQALHELRCDFHVHNGAFDAFRIRCHQQHLPMKLQASLCSDKAAPFA